MNKKENYQQGQIITVDQGDQGKVIENKKYSKAYYKLLHTYNTLTSQSKTQPISIHNCGTPIIAERLFGCKLNQKPQFRQEIARFLKEKQQRKNKTLPKNKKQQNLEQTQINNQIISENVDDEDGFQIGEKDELDEVMQMGKKLVGGWMKGFLPGINLTKK